MVLHHVIPDGDDSTLHLPSSLMASGDRVSDAALWHAGLWGPETDRGPDPVWEYEKFRAKVLESLGAGERLWQRPICEVVFCFAVVLVGGVKWCKVSSVKWCQVVFNSQRCGCRNAGDILKSLCF